MRKQTGSQTVGPFFAFGLIRDPWHILVTDESRGQRIQLVGQVLDGEGTPVKDAMVEIWQADAQGIFNDPQDPRYADADHSFRGFGRSDTVDEGTFRFKTIKPGAVAAAEADGTMQAPHVNVRVFSRGMLIHAVTRLYFSDEEAANAEDPVLNLVDADRRQTLIAARLDNEDLPTYRMDIHLQGDQETVFFDP